MHGRPGEERRLQVLVFVSGDSSAWTRGSEARPRTLGACHPEENVQDTCTPLPVRPPLGALLFSTVGVEPPSQKRDPGHPTPDQGSPIVSNSPAALLTLAVYTLVPAPVKQASERPLPGLDLMDAPRWYDGRSLGVPGCADDRNGTAGRIVCPETGG